MVMHLQNQAIVLSKEPYAVVHGAWQWCALPAGPERLQ